MYRFALHRSKGVQDKHFEQGCNPAAWANCCHNVIKRFGINQIKDADNQMLTNSTTAANFNPLIMNQFDRIASPLHYSMPYDKLRDFVGKPPQLPGPSICWCLPNFSRLMVLVQRHECKNPGYRLFTAYLIHFLHENIHADFHTRIPDGFHPANQLDNGSGRNGMGKINAVGRYRNASQPGKPRRGNKSDLVHHRQRSTAEKGVVMVGIIRKNSFKNAGFRGGNSFFECQNEMY